PASDVRVVADPGTNSILVKAKPLEMLAIKRMVEKFLDQGPDDTDATLKTHFLRLVHSNAHQLPTTLRDVYGESVDNSPGIGQPGGRFGFGAFGQNNRNVDANGSPRGVSLSISVDDATNSLIMNTTTTMFNEIQKLVDKLELAAKDSTRTV